MMCHRIGRPPISTMGFGRTALSSLIRVPKPPARITTFMWHLFARWRSRRDRELNFLALLGLNHRKSRGRPPQGVPTDAKEIFFLLGTETVDQSIFRKLDIVVSENPIAGDIAHQAAAGGETHRQKPVAMRDIGVLGLAIGH